MRTLQEIQPGMTLGRYEFLVPIAEGGMAAVWAARLKGSRGFSKTVAIKTMLPSISDDPAFEQMFLDEAQIAARIRHPNVVEIMDLGEEKEILYLVMEWVHGEPLASVRRAAAKKGGIPKPIAVRIVADASAGLHAAHELKDEQGQTLGLVHRDISPQNLLITFDGVVKIVDFGVAKAAGRTSQATTAGQVKGKPPYMSPEQALGEAIDRRTDVFALGIILYQLTTGLHPFRGESDLVTLQNIVSDKPIIPPRAHDKSFPRRLESVILKAIDRDRDRRFQSCADLEAALDEVFANELPRGRTEDVGRFMTDLLGHKGEERARAIKEALQRADERAARNPAGADPSTDEVPVTLSEAPLGDADRYAARATLSSSDIHTATPLDVTIAPPTVSRTSSKRRLVAAALVVAVGGGAWFLLSQKAAPDTQPPVEKVAAVAPIPTTPVTAATTASTQSASPPTPAVSAVAAPVAPARTATASHRAPRSSTKAGKETKTTTTKKNGFVPPPVSDPGF